MVALQFRSISQTLYFHFQFLLTEEEQTLVNDVLSSFNARRVFMNETYDVEDEIDLLDDPTPTPTGLPGIPGS